MDKRLFNLKQKVYYLDGASIYTGTIESMRINFPEEVKIRKHGRIQITNVFIDMHTALLARHIRLDEEINKLKDKISKYMQMQNRVEDNLKEYWD